ncbi:hypothetical protein [Microbacterium marinilacus]|uniref:Sortase n=1 Tax=Microbacterium marinilacus TaxID=415209 RepID=A0ABP7BGC8_9MICO|nr:hypothetical protein [Microbacterium marinilacus]MBY0689017.1 hypothetical protein [Microbacterium marinilacus]
MSGGEAALAAITEILTWAGLGAGALFGGLALIIRLADGTWQPVRAVIIGSDPAQPRVVRWFGDDGVHEAPLTAEFEEAAERDEVPLHHRVGSRSRVRLEARSPWPRLLGGVALACAGVGLLSLVVQIVGLMLAG